MLIKSNMDNYFTTNNMSVCLIITIIFSFIFLAGRFLYYNSLRINIFFKRRFAQYRKEGIVAVKECTSYDYFFQCVLELSMGGCAVSGAVDISNKISEYMPKSSGVFADFLDNFNDYISIIIVAIVTLMTNIFSKHLNKNIFDGDRRTLRLSSSFLVMMAYIAMAIINPSRQSLISVLFMLCVLLGRFVFFDTSLSAIKNDIKKMSKFLWCDLLYVFLLVSFVIAKSVIFDISLESSCDQYSVFVLNLLMCITLYVTNNLDYDFIRL